ncbi:MAG: family 10 glycosylhydrolase [Leptolyngbyaceae bacterium]|nr:family 10 glycosylhydrolase [Leptolyngbyaceae bacterium]
MKIFRPLWMSLGLALRKQHHLFLRRSCATVVLASSMISQGVGLNPAQAQTTAYCQLTAEAIAQKDTLRLAAVTGDSNAKARYQALLTKHTRQLQQCRKQTWPQNQAIWIRLYPCDLRPGALDQIMDQIINRGYNEVYVEVFYSGQVLLPAATNKTPWPSVVRTPGLEKADLLAQAIAKGHERGLRVYAWMFTMNFGYSYALRSDRQQALARNGKGQTTVAIADQASLQLDLSAPIAEETFIDPYSRYAQYDYYQLVQEIVKRRPDGVLFDYVRYPRGLGTASLATSVQDLWIYGEASQQSLLQRALNPKGQELIRRFLTRGYITVGDVQSVDKLYPQQNPPLWEGHTVTSTKSLTPSQQQVTLQQDLWYLSVAHAVQGILDFLTTASLSAQRQGVPSGAVFFPGGNQVVGQGFDSRLQAWDRFPATLEWHPMAYAVCGATNANCIVEEVRRVLSQAAPETQVKPVLAGIWGKSISNRPSLEQQMAALRQAMPQINSVSHFAFSWQEPQSDRNRKFCQLQPTTASTGVKPE